MDVYEASIPEVVIAPDPFEQLLARQDLACVGG
jgi:hypothetical protein